MKCFFRQSSIYTLTLILALSVTLTEKTSKPSSFLATQSNDLDDDFGDFNMEDLVLNQSKPTPPTNIKPKEEIKKLIAKKVETPPRKVTKLKITSNYKKPTKSLPNLQKANQPAKKMSTTVQRKPPQYSFKQVKKEIKKEEKKKEEPKKEAKPPTVRTQIQKVEKTNTASSDVKPEFINDLLRLQSNPTFEHLSNLLQTSSKKPETILSDSDKVSYSKVQKVEKDKLQTYFKSDIVDPKPVKSLYQEVNKLKGEVNKRQIEDESLSITKLKLQKNFDNLNNQIMISQSKLESVLNEIKFQEEVKNYMLGQVDKIKDSELKAADSKDFLKKISDDVKEKSEKIRLYTDKLKNDVEELNKKKINLSNEMTKKADSYEKEKEKYEKIENMKNSYVDSIKKAFESFDKREAEYLKAKDEEHDIKMELKNEENIEKLLALDIEHLKSTNLLETNKIEELKADLEKSSNSRDYLSKEIQELVDKVSSTENDNKQKQLEYEIQKSNYEQKLKSLRAEIASLRKTNSKDLKAYSSIENDIKNKISYISLQNNNIIEKSSGSTKALDEVETNFIEKSAKNINEDKQNETKELLEFLSNNNIRNIEDLQKKLVGGNEGKAADQVEDEKGMKDQIMSLLSQISK